MITFSDLWQVLYDNGSSNYYKYDCNQIWESITPAQRQKLYDNITSRLREGKYVAYNPLEAIHDNLPRRQVQSIGVPTDWNGRVAPEPTEIACYNGHWGMYTLTDIKTFNLQTKKKCQQ